MTRRIFIRPRPAAKPDQLVQVRPICSDVIRESGDAATSARVMPTLGGLVGYSDDRPRPAIGDRRTAL